MVKTYEGRTLYHLTITSLANHKRLDEIKADDAKLSEPRKLKGPEQANRLLRTHPAAAMVRMKKYMAGPAGRQYDVASVIKVNCN